MLYDKQTNIISANIKSNKESKINKPKMKSPFQLDWAQNKRPKWLSPDGSWMEDGRGMRLAVTKPDDGAAGASDGARPSVWIELGWMREMGMWMEMKMEEMKWEGGECDWLSYLTQSTDGRKNGGWKRRITGDGTKPWRNRNLSWDRVRGLLRLGLCLLRMKEMRRWMKGKGQKTKNNCFLYFFSRRRSNFA